MGWGKTMSQEVDLELLAAPMADRDWEAGLLEVQPLAECHKEGWRACCPADDPVWEIYPFNLSGAQFDQFFAASMNTPGRMAFAVLQDGVVRGSSSFMGITPARQTLEVGGTYLTPNVRGSGLNDRLKRLMLDRAFACGFRRVQFLIDARNARSQAAVMKLGAVKEGVLRAERITWTGHVRDTAIYSILAEEWATKRSAELAEIA